MIDIELLKKGNILPAFCLPAASGGEVRIGELRGRRNLVLFLTHAPGCRACEEKLRELSETVDKLRDEEAEVLAIVPGPPAEVGELGQRLGTSFPLLVDVGKTMGGGAAIVVTDRFGEIFALARSGEEHGLPSAADIAGELAFIGVQCPE